MRNIYHLDYESTSKCKIDWGNYRYAADPSTRIIIFAISKNGAPPLVWDSMDPFSEMSLAALALLREACEDPDALIYAHYAMMEVAMSVYRMLADLGIEPPDLNKWRCTLCMCRRAAIPPALGDASAFLKLGEAKDKRGKALINIFSDQNKLTLIHRGSGKAAEKRKVASPILEDPVPWDWSLTVAGETFTVRQAWDMFLMYCRQDVIVEMAIHEALAKFELEGAELEGFLFDLRMNHRGVPVNVKALRNAYRIAEGHRGNLEVEFKEITGLLPSQTAKVQAWLRENNYKGNNLQAATMEENLDDPELTENGSRALKIRSELSFAAVKKIPTMLGTVCPDGRMRGLFNWYGAQRTGRWTSSGPQLQNARKPTIDDHEDAYSNICKGVDLDVFEFAHGNPYEAIASCVRNFVQPKDGLLLDADYSNIESRVAALIAGQEDMLQAYRDGRDLYKELASVIFQVPLDQVTKEQRFVAKTASLACVYQTGAKTFHETCAMWGMPIEKKLACHTVRVFRETNAEFPKTWRRFEAAAVKAIQNPGQWFEANEWVKFASTRKAPFPRMVMRICSGRDLVYPLPAVERTLKRHKDYETGEVREWESNDITFYGARQGYAGWGRVSTYAGDLFQSAVQATARDIMQHGMVNADRLGFEIVSTIHDQALAEEGCPEKFRDALCKHPDWLPDDFPLASTSALVKYYSKD